MIEISSEALAAQIGATLAGDTGLRLRRVVTDTRQPLGPGDLFVALRGPRFDGHDHVASAWRGGASAVLVQRSPSEVPPGRAALVVADPLAALQQIAAHHRATYTGRVVAITGSNGKTITRELALRMLHGRMQVAASPMSWNSQIGVALALLQMPHDADAWLVECGASRPGEITRLAAMVRPDLGVLTTIGDAHLEGFGSRETTAAEKASLFAACGPGTVRVPDDEALALAALGVRARSVPMAPAAAVLASLDADHPGAFDTFVRANVLWRDAWLARSLAHALGVDDDDLLSTLAGWKPSGMRLETVTTPEGVLLINDAYTADPASVAAALRTLAAERVRGRRWAVLGAMHELGTRSASAHADAGRLVARLGIEGLVAVGPAAAPAAVAAIEAGLDASRVHAVDDVDGAALVLEEALAPGDAVLLKASRPVALERVASMLFAGLAPSRVTVDLDAMAENVALIRAAIPRGTGIMAVLKASGYGLDPVRVARALAAIGVEHFAVAYADEGVELRRRGITQPILVQFPRQGEVGKLVRHALTVEVGDRAPLTWLADAARAARQRVPVHLKIETGMSRSGFDEMTLPDALALLDASWLDVRGVMTHFAASEAPEHDAFSRTQLQRFEDALAAIRAGGHDPGHIHACNSSAIFRFPDAHYTMVRVGLGLYGYMEGVPEVPQRPVLRMTSRVLLVRDVATGQSVGYGRTWVAPSARRVAVVATGYADGYPRALSNRGWMQVRGVACPVVGRVCMDVCFVDVTDAGDVGPDDEVVVFGAGEGEPRVEELAELAGSIPHEFLTRLSARVRRVFAGSHGFRRT